MNFNRITIFTGNYGSGKTELAINYSLLLARQNSPVLLVDLDLINPYFRSREKAEILAEKGVEVIYPKNLVYADLPVIPPAVNKLIGNQQYSGVIDVGGDQAGATALGSISDKLRAGDYEMNLVINTLREQTANLPGIIAVKERIEQQSKLSFDHIICNVNLGSATTIADIAEGYQLIKEGARVLELPIKFIALREDLLPLANELAVEEQLLPIKLFMKPPWVR